MSSFYEQSARFYTQTQQGVVPFSEVPKAKGGGMRRATIADAKAMNPKPLPSVTSVLKVLARPALESWKMRKVAEAALTLPRLPDETDEEFIARIADDAFEEAGERADFGTAIHDDLANFISNEFKEEETWGYANDCKRWLKENVTKVLAFEKVVASSVIGYAGRMDLACELSGRTPCIIDYKSQRVRRSAKGEPKPVFYSEWVLQLSSYAFAYGIPDSELVSIIIDTSEPGPCFVKKWTQDHACAYYFDLFSKVLALWKYNNEW